MERRTADAASPDDDPESSADQSSTLRIILRQAKIDRDEFREAYEKA